MELQTALDAARHTHQSVLVTLKGDGRPQLSNVLHGVGGDDVVSISTTADRAKTHNLRARPWAALHVNGESFWSYAVIEAEVELSEVAREPGDAVVEELVALYRAISGKEHPDWDDYRRVMVEERRVVLRLRPTRAYGALR